jgi:hypothetical protein
MVDDDRKTFLEGLGVNGGSSNGQQFITTNIEEVENPEVTAKNNPVIGLFGTCGGSKWRDKFIEEYTKKGIYYFNPNKENWDPSCAISEAKHLASDEIILFPVTSETYGTGSLSEVGFSIIQAIEKNRGARIVIMIDKQLDDSLDNPVARKESSRARAIISEHLTKIQAKNVYVTDNLDEKRTISQELYEVCKMEKKIREKLEQKKIPEQETKQ